ncbi:hypothetical protein F5Y07DRAFT_351705 [Xylaria sp. FL0933]|nr:hypothetical protein F5Y07DRAFT_351705 [Xylaria sp. FL0933]
MNTKLVIPFILSLVPRTALAISSALEPRSGSFYDQCPESNLYHSTIKFKCHATRTSTDLNHAIGNVNGTLIWS